MPNRAEVDVWLVNLDQAREWLPATPAEVERAARFLASGSKEQYLRSHAALRSVLGKYTSAPLEFAAAEHGKPYLPAVPELKFNLSHSHDLALVAVCLGTDIGVDVEKLRPLQECLAIAERFFPPLEAAAFAELPALERETQFFYRWARIEARLKARGIGLYGAGAELDGEWSVLPVDAGPAYAAAVAACRGGMTVHLHRFDG